MSRYTIAIRAAAAGALCLATGVPSLASAQRPDSAALVTLLGRDTLGVERWVRRGNTITAESVVRTPRTVYRRYELELAPDGTMRRFRQETLDPAAPARPTASETLEVQPGGVWRRTLTQGDSTATSQLQADARALPFVDLVHWPYELVAQRAIRDGVTSQPLLTGSRATDFPLTRQGTDQVVIMHPARGPSTARLDAQGRLLSFDGAGATRKVRVSRVPWLSIEQMATRWAAADRTGRGVGELSGRGSGDMRVGNARIQLDYGTPTRRGREIWGAVVPYGSVWRTGANRATHLTTDRTLRLGDAATGVLTVPPGEYTLFSIPAADGGQLIVNRQTGQSGTAHDATRDLGRVRLQRRALPESVEQFTIEAAPLGGNRGELRLSWDRTALVVPFQVVD